MATPWSWRRSVGDVTGFTPSMKTSLEVLSSDVGRLELPRRARGRRSIGRLTSLATDRGDVPQRRRLLLPHKRQFSDLEVEHELRARSLRHADDVCLSCAFLTFHQAPNVRPIAPGARYLAASMAISSRPRPASACAGPGGTDRGRRTGEKGFGTGLIERACPHELAGEVEPNYAPEGLRCEIVF
jgi:hypothetical protein